MSRKVLAESGPSLVLAFGIVASTIIAVSAPGSWWALAVLLLVLSMAAADLLATKLQGGPRALSAGMLIVAVSILLANVVLGLHDPALVGQFIPIFGAGAAAVLLLRIRRAGGGCGVAWRGLAAAPTPFKTAGAPPLPDRSPRPPKSARGA